MVLEKLPSLKCCTGLKEFHQDPFSGPWQKGQYDELSLMFFNGL